MKIWKLSIFLSILMPIYLFAHADEEHAGAKNHTEQVSAPITISEELNQNKRLQLEEDRFRQIDNAYRIEVKNIIVDNCFDCHGTPEEMPWYYIVPGVRQLIEQDIKEAKEHLDMTNDFPFKSHASPTADLEELKEVIRKDEMPPFIYRIGHRDSKLEEAEKEALIKWIDASLKILRQPYQ